MLRYDQVDGRLRGIEKTLKDSIFEIFQNLESINH